MQTLFRAGDCENQGSSRAELVVGDGMKMRLDSVVTSKGCICYCQFVRLIRIRYFVAQYALCCSSNYL